MEVVMRWESRWGSFIISLQSEGENTLLDDDDVQKKEPGGYTSGVQRSPRSPSSSSFSSLNGDSVVIIGAFHCSDHHSWPCHCFTEAPPFIHLFVFSITLFLYSLHGHVFTFLLCLSHFLSLHLKQLYIGWLHTAVSSVIYIFILWCYFVILSRWAERHFAQEVSLSEERGIPVTFFCIFTIQNNRCWLLFQFCRTGSKLGSRVCCRNFNYDSLSVAVQFFSSAEPWSLVAQTQSSSSAFDIERGCRGFMCSSLSSSLLWFITFTSVKHLQHCELEEIVAMWPDVLSCYLHRLIQSIGRWSLQQQHF